MVQKVLIWVPNVVETKDAREFVEEENGKLVLIRNYVLSQWVWADFLPLFNFGVNTIESVSQIYRLLKHQKINKPLKQSLSLRSNSRMHNSEIFRIYIFRRIQCKHPKNRLGHIRDAIGAFDWIIRRFDHLTPH